MVTLQIGDAERKLARPSDIEEGWLNRQIQARRADGATVCVTITIESTPVSLALPVGDCPRARSRHRRLHPDEDRVLALWREHDLVDADFASGRLIAFLHQVFGILP